MTRINCDTVPELDHLEVDRESVSHMTYITIVNERGGDKVDDGARTQRAEVHLSDDSVSELVHALGGVTQQDLEVWMANNSGDQMLMRSFIEEGGYFPKPKPDCEHNDLKLEQDTWSPGYEALHASCVDCGIVLRLDQSEDEFEVED